MDDFRKILLTVAASMLMFVSATVIVTSENDMEVEAYNEQFAAMSSSKSQLEAVHIILSVHQIIMEVHLRWIHIVDIIYPRT